MRSKRHKTEWQLYAVWGAAMFLLISTTISVRASTKPAQQPFRPAHAMTQAGANITPNMGAIVWEEEPEEVIEPPVYIPEEETLPEQETLIGSRDWDGNDAEILMQIAMAEAEGEGVEGKAMVMLVVLNRVWSDGFPDSIEAVVFQKNQFTPVQPGGRYWTTTPDAECREALELVSNGWDESQGALFFEATSNTGTWHKNNLQYLFQLGNHIFYTTKEANS